MLMAVRHAILTSAKTKSNTSIYLQMDNKTAPSYVWKIREGGWRKWGGGGVPTTNIYSTSASQFGHTSFQKRITITAKYLPSTLNIKEIVIGYLDMQWTSSNGNTIFQFSRKYFCIWGQKKIDLFG